MCFLYLVREKSNIFTFEKIHMSTDKQFTAEDFDNLGSTEDLLELIKQNSGLYKRCRKHFHIQKNFVCCR